MNHGIDDYDYRRFAILFIEEDTGIRQYFTRLFGQRFSIVVAQSGSQALAILNQMSKEIGVILTTRPRTGFGDAKSLAEITDLYPEIVRILSGPYSDHDPVIGAVNQGGIFWNVTEPWDVPELEVTLRRALEFFMVRHERDELREARRQACG